MDVAREHGGAFSFECWLAVEGDVALKHGQEPFAVGRIAGLDQQVQDQAAPARGQVELVARNRRALHLRKQQFLKYFQGLSVYGRALASGCPELKHSQ